VSIADHLMIMVNGQVVRYGKPSEVMASLQTPTLHTAQKTQAGAA